MIGYGSKRGSKFLIRIRQEDLLQDDLALQHVVSTADLRLDLFGRIRMDFKIPQAAANLLGPARSATLPTTTEKPR